MLPQSRAGPWGQDSVSLSNSDTSPELRFPRRQQRENTGQQYTLPSWADGKSGLMLTSFFPPLLSPLLGQLAMKADIPPALFFLG